MLGLACVNRNLSYESQQVWNMQWNQIYVFLRCVIITDSAFSILTVFICHEGRDIWRGKGYCSSSGSTITLRSFLENVLRKRCSIRGFSWLFFLFFIFIKPYFYHCFLFLADIQIVRIRSHSHYFLFLLCLLPLPGPSLSFLQGSSHWLPSVPIIP